VAIMRGVMEHTGGYLIDNDCSDEAPDYVAVKAGLLDVGLENRMAQARGEIESAVLKVLKQHGFGSKAVRAVETLSSEIQTAVLQAYTDMQAIDSQVVA
jgi:hypothetical protein